MSLRPRHNQLLLLINGNEVKPSFSKLHVIQLLLQIIGAEYDTHGCLNPFIILTWICAPAGWNESPNSFLGHPQKMCHSDIWELSNNLFLLRYPCHLWWHRILGLGHSNWDQVVELLQGKHSCIIPRTSNRKTDTITMHLLPNHGKHLIHGWFSSFSEF